MTRPSINLTVQLASEFRDAKNMAAVTSIFCADFCHDNVKNRANFCDPNDASLKCTHSLAFLFFRSLGNERTSDIEHSVSMSNRFSHDGFGQPYIKYNRLTAVFSSLGVRKSQA